MAWRKWRAAVLMTLLSGGFWGVAAVLGRLGYELINGGMVLPGDISSTLLRMFLLGGTFGVVGGALFTGGLVLFGRGSAKELSTVRAALVGGLAGAGAVLGIRLWSIPTPAGVSAGLFSLVSVTVFGILGAAMGAALLGSSRQSGQLAKGGNRELNP